MNLIAKPGFVRARTNDQIEIRRAEILAAAAELIMESGFDNVSLNGIARHVGIAKSNLYRYFDGKEEIIFQVMLADYSEWFEDLKTRLKDEPKPAADIDVARQLTASLTNRERLCHFISVKASVVEKNLSAETSARFSEILMPAVSDLGAVFMACLPHLNGDQVMLLLKTVHAIIAGLWPMSQHQIHATGTPLPELASWQTNFHRDLEQSTYYLLVGLRHG